MVRTPVTAQLLRTIKQFGLCQMESTYTKSNRLVPVRSLKSNRLVPIRNLDSVQLRLQLPYSKIDLIRRRIQFFIPI